uniref:Protein PRRC2A n=1 Tax=Cacopsylla melanoneura TaxID=428564 RepID=A0A8D8XYR6_9HEMI
MVLCRHYAYIVRDCVEGGESKAQIPDTHLNNVFSKSTGESSKPNQLKTPFNKHGMSVLGKVPSARKPTNLPSLKSENTGNDPPVHLVPTGGPGWGSKPGETGPPPPTPSVQQNTAVVVPTPPITTINTSIPPPPIVDKSWSAKTAGKPNYNTTHQTPLFNQEFPSLSGNPADVQYGPGPSLRPQTIKGSWIQGGSHPPTGGEVGNQQGTAPVQDHPTETLRPEVAAILPSFMQKQETHLQFASFSNPPPPTRLAQRFSQPNSNHDTRFMQHPPPSRNKDFVQCAKIVKEDALSKFDDFSKKGGWALHDSIDYDQKLNFSDDETEESENKENDISSRFNDKSGAISEKTTSHHIEDEVKQLKKKEMNEIIEKAKVRKESEEQRFIEQKNNAAKKLAALDRKIEESKKENESKDERKTTGQPVVKDGNEFRQLTQLGNDKPQSYNKEPANNFTSSRFSTSNKPPRLRKQEENQQHKGFYSRPSQERNYYEGDYERDNRSDNRYRDYNSRDRFSMNNRDTRDREYSRGGYDNRKFSDQMRNPEQKSNYNRDSEAKYQGRYSDSSDHRDSWEMLPKRKDSDRSKQSYDDDNERYRSDNESREKNNKDMNSWEMNDYENHADYEREEMWEKERRIERPTRPDSRDSRTSRESKTSHSELNLRDEKLNVIDDPEETHEIERERKPMNMNMYKNTRGAGVPITIEKLEAAESKQDKSSELVPLVRSDKGDYKKDGKDEDKKQLDAWSTPLNTSKFHSEQKKEDSPPIETEKLNENNQDKQVSEENGDKDKERKEDKETANKKERGDRDRDAHHRDRGNRGRDRYQGGRSSEWSSNSYNSGGNRDNGRSWGREGKDSRDTRYDNRRGHSRAPPARISYPRHPRSESDPESGKEDRYHDQVRGERRVEKGRKERDDAWYGERDRYGDRKERDRYYESRGSREYPRGGGGGGSNYRSSNQPSGQGRRNDNYGGSSKNNFSGDEKKPREKKEATSEDDKKEKKTPSAKPLGNKPSRDNKTEKDWESDGKESLDDDKYKRGGSYSSSRGSRGARSSYSASARKNDKFTKERPVKEENKEDIENSESNDVKSKESSGEKQNEHGFQEVKAKKNATNVKETSNTASKKTDEKSKPKETPKSASSSSGSASLKQNSSSGNQTKSSSNSTSKGNGQQTQSKPGADKSKNEHSSNQQKKSEPVVEETKSHGFSLSGVKDIVTGPAPPPPATNAWDRPLNAAVLKSSSPAPTAVQKTQTPPPRPASSASSHAASEVAHSVDDSASQAHQQQQQQHLQNQQQQYAQYQQHQAEQQQQLQQQQQAQLAAAVQAQQQQQQQQLSQPPPSTTPQRTQTVQTTTPQPRDLHVQQRLMAVSTQGAVTSVQQVTSVADYNNQQLATAQPTTTFFQSSHLTSPFAHYYHNPPL